MSKTWLGLLTLIYGLLYYNKHYAGIVFPFHGQMADFLAFPLMLGYILLAMRWLYGQDYHIPLHFVLITLLFFAFYFEWILPKWKSDAVGDLNDVVAYVLGCACWILLDFRNRRIRNSDGLES